MPGGLSQSSQQKVLDYLFGGTAFPNIAGPHLLALSHPGGDSCGSAQSARLHGLDIRS